MAETGKTSHKVSSVVEDMNSSKALEFIEHVTKNAGEIQVTVLTEILCGNAHVEYLQRHGLDGRTDRETFRKVIPVVEYEDLIPDIERIVNGDTSPILCSHPICEIQRSSATSGGQNKLFPMTEEELDRRAIVSRLGLPVVSKSVKGLEKGKGMNFAMLKPDTKTPCGLPVRLGSSSIFKWMSATNPNLFNSYTSPIETILCTDSFQSLYSQALCGLAQRDEVLWVGSAFALGFIRAIKFIQKHWKMLSNDIRSGTPDPNILTDSTVRKAVCDVLVRPNQDLADFVEAECGKESWKGIIKRLWPKAKLINAIMTGAMEQYVPMLDYYSDGLPLVSLPYFSSECFFGLNLHPLTRPSEVSYTLLPHTAYFEFLPINKTTDDGGCRMDKLVQLVDVELGKEYELHLTTYTGLYRYRMGDVLRVTGFYNCAPQFKFVRRANVILTIDQDKTNEVELHNAINNAVTSHLHSYNYSLLDYTSYADTSTIPGHYIIFWEISQDYNNKNVTINNVLPASVFIECCSVIEESLDSSYREYRVPNGTIGPLELRVVEGGTFDEMMDYAISVGGSMSQYKTPKCVKNPHMLQILNSRMVSKHFSPKCPKWTSLTGEEEENH